MTAVSVDMVELQYQEQGMLAFRQGVAHPSCWRLSYSFINESVRMTRHLSCSHKHMWRCLLAFAMDFRDMFRETFVVLIVDLH